MTLHKIVVEHELGQTSGRIFYFLLANSVIYSFPFKYKNIAHSGNLCY